MGKEALTLENYKIKIETVGFQEHPETIDGINDQYFKDILKGKELHLNLKIYLTSTLICRCVGINGGIYLPADVGWWIEEFKLTPLKNKADFTRSEAILQAIEDIQSDNAFGKCVIGTAFMYTVLEFYSKHYLGFEPNTDVLNNDLTKIKKYQETPLSDSFIKLKKRNLQVSRQLCKIDKFFKQKAQTRSIEILELNNSYLAYRLSKGRNMVLHGQYPFLHSEGTLLVLLYILYAYCHLLEEEIANI